MDPVCVFLPYIEYAKSKALYICLDAPTNLYFPPVDVFSQVPSTICMY